MEDSDSTDNEKVYVVQAVRGVRGSGSKKEFLIKWDGYDEYDPFLGFCGKIAMSCSDEIYS
jgi:hypothetical protein